MRSQNRSAPAALARRAGGISAYTSAMVVCLGTVVGCAQTAVPPVAPAGENAPTEPASARVSQDWEFVEGGQLPIRLRLPGAAQWQRRETKTSLTLDHPATRSHIVIRLWSATRLVTAEQCLDDFGLVEPTAKMARGVLADDTSATTPDAADGVLVARDRFEPGADFHGTIRAAVHSDPAGSETAGYVVAVATSLGRCLALLGTTTVAGASAEGELAERLAWMVEGVTKSLSVRSVESRIHDTR